MFPVGCNIINVREKKPETRGSDFPLGRQLPQAWPSLGCRIWLLQETQELLLEDPGQELTRRINLAKVD